MKKLIAYVASAAVLAGVSLSAVAAEKSAEETCKDRAAQHKIAADKTDAYVQSCVKKMQHHHHSSTPPASTGESGSNSSAPAK